MLSESLVFGLIIFISIKSDLISAVNEDEINGKLRVQRDGFADSFRHLIGAFKSLLGLRYDYDNSKRLKTAFSSAFEDINKKKDTHRTKFHKQLFQPDPIDRRPQKNIFLGTYCGDSGCPNVEEMNKGITKTDDNLPKLSAWYTSEDLFVPEKSAEHLIEVNGYKPQSHTVLTEDGYMLTMQRILPDLNAINKKKPVVLLHHGLFGSSEDWLLIGKFKALPYMLTDSGFDVWLLNARGNKYSKSHTTKTTKNEEFWNFSFHEIGVYDLPAAIKYVIEVTGQAEINYIGHSLGSTVLLILLSTFPEYNLIMRAGILMAPLAYMYHARGPIRLLADFYRKNGRNSLYFLGNTEFYPHGNFPEQIVNKYCKGSERACANPLLLLCNGGKEPSSESLMQNILSHAPGGGSVKTLIHYVQFVTHGFFQSFDYGERNNTIKYSNVTAPFYNLKEVTLPLAIFSSPSDWLSTEPDIRTLMSLLKDVNVHHVVKAADFGHYDYMWSPVAPELVYDFILSILWKILPKDDVAF